MNEVLFRIIVLILLTASLYFIPTTKEEKININNDLKEIDETNYFPEEKKTKKQESDPNNISEYL
tara:strand:- start:262 stop:456 length:195 start_codon:yes stop_codon:yes gene_type:complete